MHQTSTVDIAESRSAQKSEPDFLSGSGDIGSLVAAVDWAATPLGPIAHWPQSLRLATAMILRSPVAMVLLWGEDGILIYNEGYAAIAGRRHPAILGVRAVDAFPEIAAFNAQVLATCLAGNTLALKDQRFTLNRHGAPEDVWLDLGYSPVLDEFGCPAGVLAVVVETTARTLADERLRVAQEAGRFGAFEWFPQTGALVGCDTYRQIFWLGPDDALSEASILALIPPEERPPSGAERLQRPGNPLAYAEYRIRNPKSGEIRWIARRGDVLQGPRGALPRYIGVTWDITEKKFAELQDAFLAGLSERLGDLSDPIEVIRVAADSLGRYLGAGRVGFGDIDDAGEFATISADWTDGVMPTMAGRYRVDAFGDAVVGALKRGETVRIADTHNDPRLSGAVAMAAVDAIGMGAGISVPLIRDGRFVGILFAHTAEPRRWDDREEALMHAVAARTWDAARRAAAERSLRESEENFRLLAEALPNQVWVTAPDHRILWVNEQAYAYMGAAPGELQREDWTRVVHPDDQAASMAAWTHALATGTVYETEYRLLRHDGTYRWHIARALPSRGPDGAILRWIGANTDIEVQRQALADLAALNATLEERVEARTRELRLAEEALRQAQKMEAIGQLTGGIAHDFNNLLTGIIGSLDLVRRRLATGRTADLDRFMEAASGSALSAAALTHRLLAFARRQSLDSKPVDVDELVRGMEDLLRRTLGEQVRLHIAPAAGCWHAMTDPNQLESAILNLAINARDAMPDGGRLSIGMENLTQDRVAIDGREQLEPGDYVAIIVTDSGVGMPREVMERAFEPFFTTKPAGQGTGLGLSMVYGFARQSGGHVRIACTPGQGTSVTLTLPRASPTPADAVTAAASAPLGAGETVLVVEDVAAVRMLVIDVLQDLGYRTIEAADADQALPIIESSRPIDLMISDVGLPGLNGRQLADHARCRRPGLKVLFLTGYAEHAASRSGFLSDGMALLTKPFAVETLASKISEMMAGR
jgi:PAS domain S-box-containing protein